MAYTIPKNEQDGVMDTFWSMLMECESQALNDNDPVLKHHVSQYFKQWNRITGNNNVPRWEKQP